MTTAGGLIFGVCVCVCLAGGAGGGFPGGGMSKFCGGERLPHIPVVGKTLVLFTTEQVLAPLFQFYKMWSYYGQWYSMPKARST